MKTLFDIPEPVAKWLMELPDGLKQHIERSRAVGDKLARFYQMDSDRVDMGLICHDLARHFDDSALLAEAQKLGLYIGETELRAPFLIHGAVAAEWLIRDGGVSDEDVIMSVRWHTTGRREMSGIEKIVFLADKLDPRKVEAHPELTEVQEAALCSIDGAILKYLDWTLHRLISNGLFVHPASIWLRNDLIADLNSKMDG